MDRETPSIFNHVIGPIMRGPSSSHTAASVRIGLLGKNLLGEQVKKAVFTFAPDGSLATTYRGQGSAMGLAAGLIGMDISDTHLIEAEALCKQQGIQLVFAIEKFHAPHPNTYKVELTGQVKRVSFTALSVGGGVIQLVELNGAPVADDSQYTSALMPVTAVTNPDLPFACLNDLLYLLEQQNEKLSMYALQYESALGGISQSAVKKLAAQHLEVMESAIIQGLEGTTFQDRILPRQSHLIEQNSKNNKLVPAPLINSVIQNVTAVMETKSSMGLIVAAPTAGSCGVIPGCLSAVGKSVTAEQDEMQKALLSAGLIGVFICRQGGFAAEEGGCQYECGAASAMAAAALVDLMGGKAKTAINAASMALQNTLGLICDPVADRVEIPCLGKNIMAALNGIAAANMAMAGFAHVIPLDQVIDSMKEVGENMPSKYRCTCKGGLSITSEAKRIEKALHR